MNRGVSRHDLSWLVSTGLLIAAIFTAVTGLISDLWDLNEFFYHKYTGYTLAVLGLAHVYLQWKLFVSYCRWRLGGHPRWRRTSSRLPVQNSRLRRGSQSAGTANGAGSPAAGKRKILSRRDFLPLTIGGLGGLALGSILFPKRGIPYGGDLGIVYHEWSKPKLQSLLGTVTDWGRRPPPYKEYASAQRLSLRAPGAFRGLYTEEAIGRRRSTRSYSGRTMSQDELSRLLYHAGGINGERWGHKLRAAPSAGALYPIELYPVVHRVEALRPGLYHYAVQEHALELLRPDDLRQEIVIQGLMQEFLGQANLVLVFTAIFQRLRVKYQERAYRYALIEAGHLGQNVYLAATSMGMGACAVGAFLDDGLNALLDVDGQEEAAIYMLAVGKL